MRKNLIIFQDTIDPYRGYKSAIILNIAANLHLLHVIPVTSASVKRSNLPLKITSALGNGIRTNALILLNVRKAVPVDIKLLLAGIQD